MKKNLFVFVAGSGTGKTTLLKKLCEENNFEKLITTTTRNPRVEENEINGVHYFFITKDEFLKKEENGEMIEKNEFNGNLYGLSKGALLNVTSGKTPAVILEAEGAKSAKEKLSKDWNVYAIYIDENLETRISRTLKRGDSGDDIKSRLSLMKNQEEKWKNMLTYDLTTPQGQSIDELVKIVVDFSTQKEACSNRSKIKPR
jgi:guanylate kinase